MSPNIPTTLHDLIIESQIPMTLSDATLPDDPLILANEAFYRMTGYGATEVLGHNCRFMQGEGTSKNALQSIRKNFAAERDTKVLIRNYRKSGEEFDNYLYIFSLFDEDDKVIFRVASQFEIPMIGRAKAFEAHAIALHDNVEALNNSGAIARDHLINSGELVGASVKSLLMSRLDALRSS